MTPDWTDIAIPAVTLIGVTLGKGVRSLLLIIQGLFSLIWSSFAFSLSSAHSSPGSVEKSFALFPVKRQWRT